MILNRVKQIGQNEDLLNILFQNKNESIQKEISELESKKIVSKLKTAELKKQIKKLVNKYVESKGPKINEILTKEIKEMEAEREELEKKQIEVGEEITRLKDYSLNSELVSKSFEYFAKVYEKLNEIERKNLMALMIRQITFTKERVKIEFFEIPQTEIIFKKGSAVSFAERTISLPESNSEHQLSLFLSKSTK